MARKSGADEWLTEDGLIRIEGWARDGLIEKEIARNMGISEKTLSRWKDQFMPIMTALKKGKAPVDYVVENAMYKSAIGFSVIVKEPMKLKRIRYEDKKRIEEEYIEQVDREIYVQPNTVAQIYWLKNRRPDKWRDKRDPQPENPNGMLSELIQGLIDPACDDPDEEEEA